MAFTLRRHLSMSGGAGDDTGAEESAGGREWGEEMAWPGGEFTAGGGGSSLVLQWLRLCVSTAGAWV